MRGAALPLALLLLAAGPGCLALYRPPDTVSVLRGLPRYQRVDLALEVAGATPGEVADFSARLAEGLGVPVNPADPPGDGCRAFRLTLRGRRSRQDAAVPLGLQVAAVPLGVLAGALGGAGIALCFSAHAAGGAALVGAGVGLAAGLAYGPGETEHRRGVLREKGFLPWAFQADLEVVDWRAPGPGMTPRTQTVSQQRRLVLDLRRHLRALPPGGRGEAEMRRASLMASAEAVIAQMQPPS